MVVLTGTPVRKIVMADSIAIGMDITIIHMRDKVVCLTNNFITKSVVEIHTLLMFILFMSYVKEETEGGFYVH